jgi:DNA mismatch repair protein MutS
LFTIILQAMSTPLMKQYSQVKARYPEAILLFRMGDFYETFEGDAVITARVLGITLTRRGNGAAGEVPLAGFPYHALDSYLPKLLKAGHRVAVCEQLEDPKLAKGVVRRDVIEVLTPGVTFSDKVLDQKQNNYLCAVAFGSPLAQGEDLVGLACIDVSTAEFSVTEIPLKDLPIQISGFSPAELLVQKRDAAALEALLRNHYRGITTKLEDWTFSFEYAHELLVNHFKTRTLKGFGLENFSNGVVAAGAVMSYLQETQKSNLLHIRRIVPFNTGDHISLDAPTRRALEITAGTPGQTEGSLFSTLDKTLTPMGGRLLKRWISQPLNRVGPINDRLDAVAELTEQQESRSALRDILVNVGDLERLNTRICTGRSTPREVTALGFILEQIVLLKKGLAQANSGLLVSVNERLEPLPDIMNLIASAIADHPPVSIADGGTIRQGYNAGLDELRSLASRGKSWVADLQRKERERTGIPSLKVGFNNVFGYYIEITNTHRDKVPADYIRKQTLAGAERFITPELKEEEEKILHAEERILDLETRLFQEVRLAIADRTEAVQNDARSIAELDCLQSLATAAAQYGYIRPIVNESATISITAGRHPVIERLLPPGDEYTPNDTVLDTDSNQILIITGPNMSGKSSYLRQTGLIVLLAQAGSFVPAAAATIGMVDKIFTRVGASDNITSGESTFLVEMHEAANIVNTATTRSLILLDEIGRGTSTFDGISIAWALTEYLHERVGARTLFATHYHELNELADLYPRIRNVKVDVREYPDNVVFLHKVVPGCADHSYGIQVAQMAGLPGEVTERAKKILRNLEGSDLIVHDDTPGRNGNGKSGRQTGRIAPGEMQITLFDVPAEPLADEIMLIDTDRMTPMDALQKLAELRALAERSCAAGTRRKKP